MGGKTNEKRELRAALITSASGLLVWSIQQMLQQATVEGLIGLFITLLLFWLYEHVCWLQEKGMVDDIKNILDEFDEEDMQKISEEASDEVIESLKRLGK